METSKLIAVFLGVVIGTIIYRVTRDLWYARKNQNNHMLNWIFPSHK